MNRNLVVISHYFPGFKVGGPQKSIKGMVAEDLDNFYIILTRNRDLREQTFYQGVRFNYPVRFSTNSVVIYYNSYFSYLRVFVSLRSKNIRNVIFNSFFDVTQLIPGLLLNRFLRYRVSIFPRGELLEDSLYSKSKFGFFKKRLFITLSKLFVSNFLFVATSNRERLSIAKLFPKSNIGIFHNNVDCPPILRYENNTLLSKGSAVEKNPMRFINFARISREKNLLGLLKFLNEFNTSPIILNFMGTIEDSDYFKLCENEMMIINRKGFHKVYYLGIFDIGRLETFQYDAMIYLGFGDNFGHVVYEALSHAIPCIIDETSFFEEIEKRNAGFLVKRNDYISFERAVAAFVNMSFFDFGVYKNNAQSYAKSYFELVCKQGSINKFINDNFK